MAALLPATLSGVAAGAALSHWLDPVAGRRRRTRVAARAMRWRRLAGGDLRAGLRDLRSRSRGLVRAVARSWDDGTEDRVLRERIRAELGFLVSHPRAIEVDAREGRVELRGAILAAEVAPLLRGIVAVRGVRDVDPAELEVHATADVAMLQGAAARPAGSRRGWSPAGRLLVAASGLGVAALTLSRFSSGGLGATALGVAAAAAARDRALNASDAPPS